ncbi:MAG: hypothetical protein RL154_1036 [Pseudomonadota bacterium]|jgi:hypothetical protein
MKFSEILKKCQQKFQIHEYDQIQGERYARQSFEIAKEYNKSHYRRIGTDDMIVREFYDYFGIEKDLNKLANLLRRRFRHLGKAGIALSRIKRVVSQNYQILVDFCTKWDLKNEIAEKKAETAKKTKQTHTENARAKRDSQIKSEAINDFFINRINKLPTKLLKYFMQE